MLPDNRHATNYMPDSTEMEKLYDAQERFIRLHRCEFPSEKDFEEWKKNVEADYRNRKKFR